MTPMEDPAASGYGLDLVVPGRHLPGGAGLAWIGDGWRLFRKAKLMWVIAVVMLFIVMLALNFIPGFGTLAFQVLNPVLTAGFVVACRHLETGGEFELEHLFAGFQKHFMRLLLVGIAFIVASALLLVAFGAIFGFEAMQAFIEGDAEKMAVAAGEAPLGMTLGVLVGVALTLPLVAATWFAPALIVIHGMRPAEAMKASLFGCFGNLIAFLLYGLVMGVLLVLAILPAGLGMLVWMPVLIASNYAAYRAIFTTGRVGVVPAGMVA